MWADGELVGVLDLLLRYPDAETVYLGLLLIERGRQGQGIGRAAMQALEGEVAARGPRARRLRLSVVRPWRYDKLESEAILMDKPLP